MRDWQRYAACVDSPIDFTSTIATDISAAIQVCGRCEVMAQCRSWADAIHDDRSVLGGESASARKARWRTEGKRRANRKTRA